MTWLWDTRIVIPDPPEWAWLAMTIFAGLVHSARYERRRRREILGPPHRELVDALKRISR